MSMLLTPIKAREIRSPYQVTFLTAAGRVVRFVSGIAIAIDSDRVEYVLRAASLYNEEQADQSDLTAKQVADMWKP
jgi:hypothetical protein